MTAEPKPAVVRVRSAVTACFRFARDPDSAVGFSPSTLDRIAGVPESAVM